MLSNEHKRARHELSEQVQNDEKSAQIGAGAPRIRNVRALFVPLEPHANTVFEECAH